MAPALLQAMALALRASTIVPTCPALPSCPQDDKCTFNANSNIFQVSCATDFYGGDLFLAQVGTQDLPQHPSVTLIYVDLNTGLLHKCLLYDQWLRCCELCWWQLLYEANVRCCSAEVGYSLPHSRTIY